MKHLIDATCTPCEGSGRVRGKVCPRCGGIGRVRVPLKPTLKDTVGWIQKSSDRLERTLAMPRDRIFWRFLRREAWIHLQRSLELLWFSVRRKER